MRSSGLMLQQVVRWALPDADFQVDVEFGAVPLRDVAMPAELAASDDSRRRRLASVSGSSSCRTAAA